MQAQSATLGSRWASRTSTSSRSGRRAVAVFPGLRVRVVGPDEPKRCPSHRPHGRDRTGGPRDGRGPRSGGHRRRCQHASAEPRRAPRHRGARWENGWRAEAWCADFARWVYGQAGGRTARLTAGAASFYAYGKANNTWKAGGTGSAARAQVGDAVVYNLNASKTWASHVGIVVAIHAGKISVVSGNSGPNTNMTTTVTVAPGAGSGRAVFATGPLVLGVLERPQHPIAMHVQLPPVLLRLPRERRLVDLAQTWRALRMALPRPSCSSFGVT